MASPLRNLAQLVTYAATKPHHDRRDKVVLADLRAEAGGLGLPAGVDVRWLGVAGFAITAEATTILIDPYVTRHPLGDFVRRRVVASNPVMVDRYVPRADAILVGHTHFDHALDVPAIARRDGAQVYGGASAAHLMGLHGLHAQAVEVQPHRPIEIGPFTVTFVPSRHSKLLLGLSVPSGGEITCEHVECLTDQAYGCGAVWGIQVEIDGATIYHQGSADLIDEEIAARSVDVFLCGIAGRQVTPDYVPRILRKLDPRTVVVSHHDDFFATLQSAERLAFGVDVDRFAEEVAAAAPHARLVAPDRPQPLP